MRIPRHDHVDIALRGPRELALERVEPVDDLFELVAKIEPDVQRHLIVAAPRGVEFFAGRTDALDQAPLDIHVDVFIGGGEAEFTLVDLLANRLEPGDDAPRLAARNDALAPEHPRVRNAAGDVVAVKPRIDVDRRGEGLDRAGGRAREASAPEF